jgi:hypothetical protein
MWKNAETAYAGGDMTEQQIFDSLCHWLGHAPADKDDARVALLAMIKETPAWVCCLPEGLLDKLGIKYDMQFDAKEINLAASIGARCERRLV